MDLHPKSVSIEEIANASLLAIFLFLFNNIGFSQDYQFSAIYRRREVVIKVFCFDDSLTVYTGKLDCYKFVNSCNATHLVKGQTYVKNDTCAVLNFCSDSLSSVTTSNNVVIVKRNQLFKIRILPRELKHFPKKKDLLICLTIDGENRQVYAKWYRSRFRLIRSRKQIPEYIRLEESK